MLQHVSMLLVEICMLRLETPGPQVRRPLASVARKNAIARIGHSAIHAHAGLSGVHTYLVAAV